MLAKSIVSKSVPLNSIYFPAGTVLQNKLHHQQCPLHPKISPRGWMEGLQLPPVPDIVSRISIFLPSQSYVIAGMEREYNIIRDICDAAASIR